MRGALLCLFTLTPWALGGCAKSPLLEQEIEDSYAEAAAVDTLHDFEVARLAAAAQLARIEGLIARERKDPELLALAVRGWCRYGFLFTWDDRELAEETSDGAAALYHGERALGGFERAGFYAAELFELMAPGYPKNKPQDLQTYLSTMIDDPEQAPYVMWAGCAELGKSLSEMDRVRRTQAQKNAQLLLEHALALDATTGDGTAELLLAAATAQGGDRKSVATHLDRAAELSKNKLLLVDVVRALLVDCAAKDERAFTLDLNHVLEAGDVSPEHRLDNVVAKRRARRYLESPAWRARCSH